MKPLRTCVSDRYAKGPSRLKLQLGTERDPSPKPSERSISRLDRLLGPNWDGVLQLDSRRARRVNPKGLTAEINTKNQSHIF
jgi:hypothetical protein